MKARSHAVVLSACLALSTCLGWAWRPTRHLADQLEKVELTEIFPVAVGAWTVDANVPVQVISPDVEAMLNKLYAQNLSRIYVNPQGQRIMLSVAYGGDQSDATRAHRPDVCYPAQGFNILSQQRLRIPLANGSLPVEHMVAQLGGRVEPVTFWFTIGEQVAVSGTDQKWVQFKYGLDGVIADGILVRVSSIDKDEREAFAVQTQFIAALRAAVPSRWTARVFGRELAH